MARFTVKIRLEAGSMRLIIVFFIFIFSFNSFAQSLSEKDRSTLIDKNIESRFKEVLPALMKRTGIDMWILISREYNEDPVLKTMLPSTWFSARRRTILVFYLHPEGQRLEKLSLSRYNVGSAIESAWDKSIQPDQWQRLREVVEEYDPQKIGINYSEDFGLADGIVYTDFKELQEVLPSKYLKRITSAEDLAIGWIETRTEAEIAILEELSEVTHQIIKEAFSREVITPHKTTTEDVVWFMRQRLSDLGYDTWFHPTVDIQRAGKMESDTILPGDLLHCDFGLSYLRLNTDCQQMAYVAKEGENTIPNNLTKAFKEGNKLQDFLISNFENGRTGNEILKRSLKEAMENNIDGMIYTHPLGTYGHSGGPTMGMWDQQDGVKGSGDYPLFPETVYAIELSAAVELPNWKKPVKIMLEEPGYWNGKNFRYLAGRQEELIFIKN